jgi:hypothetical protein
MMFNGIIGFHFLCNFIMNLGESIMMTPFGALLGLVLKYMEYNCSKNIFNFEYQFWFLGLTIIIFTKLMLCNII